MYSKYYPDSESFQKAIINCIEQASTQQKAKLESLLALNFQTFKDVPVVGQITLMAKQSKKVAGQIVSIAKQPKKNVLSKVA